MEPSKRIRPKKYVEPRSTNFCSVRQPRASIAISMTRPRRRRAPSRWNYSLYILSVFREPRCRAAFCEVRFRRSADEHTAERCSG